MPDNSTENHKDKFQSSDLSSYYPHDEFFKRTLSDPKAFNTKPLSTLTKYFLYNAERYIVRKIYFPLQDSSSV